MNRDIVMYVSTVLILYLSDYIYVYICLSAVLFLSVYLFKRLYHCSPGHIVQIRISTSEVSAGREPSPN
jgi:hypothetical protein